MTGDSDVLASELPPSDMEDAEDSETESEVEEWDTGVNPNSAKYGWRRAFPADMRSSAQKINICWKIEHNLNYVILNESYNDTLEILA